MNGSQPVHAIIREKQTPHDDELSVLHITIQDSVVIEYAECIPPQPLLTVACFKQRYNTV
jgi:hypothetical protein